MTEQTVNFLVRLAALVMAILLVLLVTLFGIAVYTGATVIPAAFQVQFWNIATTLVVLAGGTVVVFLNNRNAAMGRARSDQNHRETQAAVQEVEHTVTNGLAQKTADIVKAEAEMTAAHLAERIARQDALANSNAAAILALSAKIDLLLLATPVGGQRPSESSEGHALQDNTTALGVSTDAINQTKESLDRNTEAREGER